MFEGMSVSYRHTFKHQIFPACYRVPGSERVKYCENHNFACSLVNTQSLEKFNVSSICFEVNFLPFWQQNKGLDMCGNALHKKMKFSIKDFFTKCDRIWSHILKKFFFFVQL